MNTVLLVLGTLVVLCYGDDFKPCKDIDGLYKCLRSTGSKNPSCNQWTRAERCSERAGCSPSFIQTSKRQFEEMNGISCGKNTSTLSCRSPRAITDCILRQNITAVNCELWKGTELCLTEGDCSQVVIDMTVWGFHKASNLTCDGMEINSYDFCRYFKKMQDCNRNITFSADACRVWKQSENCMIIGGCEKRYIDFSKDILEQSTNVTCGTTNSTGNNNSTDTMFCSDIKTLEECLQYTNFSKDHCLQWKGLRKCLDKAGCSQEAIDIAAWGFQQASNESCDGYNKTEPYFCRDVGELRRCSQNMTGHSDGCRMWNQSERCMLRAGCSKTFIEFSRFRLNRFNFTCDTTNSTGNNNSTGTMGCSDIKGFEECLRNTNFSGDHCLEWKRMRKCLDKGRCSQETIDIAAWGFQQAYNESCEGLNKTQHYFCRDFGELTRCSQNMTGHSDSCRVWNEAENCMLRAGCSKTYIEFSRFTLKRVNISCDTTDKDNSTGTLSCLNAKALQGCLINTTVTEDKCLMWKGYRRCLDKAGCSQEVMDMSAWGFQKTNNVSCDGLNNTHDFCRDFEELTRCSLNITPESDICRVWSQSEKCLWKAGCEKSYIEFSKQSLAYFNISCDPDNSTDTLDCWDIKGLQGCLRNLNFSEDRCLTWKSYRGCLEKAGCSQETIDMTGWGFQKSFNLSCHGLNNTHNDYCPNFEELRRCMLNTTMDTDFDICSLWNRAEKCMLRAGCKKSYVEFSKKGLKTLNISCESEVTNSTFGCRDLTGLQKCVARMNHSDDQCRNIKQYQGCLEKASCSREIIDIFLWEYNLWRNASCSGINITSDDYCRDIGKLEVCTLDISLSDDHCRNWNQIEGCMLKANCKKRYIEIRKRLFEQANKITCSY